MGSLFDGIGGFPLAASRHGIKTVWASEIEPFPISVTKLRLGYRLKTAKPKMLYKSEILDCLYEIMVP